MFPWTEFAFFITIFLSRALFFHFFLGYELLFWFFSLSVMVYVYWKVINSKRICEKFSFLYVEGSEVIITIKKCHQIKSLTNFV